MSLPGGNGNGNGSGSNGNDAGRVAGADLVSLLYRSRATARFDPADLEGLVRGARARNEKRGVTGALYYEDGFFFQWIEGPAPIVSRLFGIIGRDRRHTDVEVVSFGQTLQRVFADWNLRLYRGFDGLAGLHPDPTFAIARGGSIDPETLRDIALGLARGRVGELALALKEFGADLRGQVRLCERLMRCYGELWARDFCTEVDIVLGLALAQAQFRLHQARTATPGAFSPGDSVLVLPVPGERHVLSASLAQASLEAAGFRVPAELPASLDGAEALLRAHGCRHAVVVTSGVLARSRRVRALSACVGRLRRMLPPGAKVMLYGQLAGVGDASLEASGCDAGSPFAQGIPGLLDPESPILH